MKRKCLLNSYFTLFQNYPASRGFPNCWVSALCFLLSKRPVRLEHLNRNDAVLDRKIFEDSWYDMG